MAVNRITAEEAMAWTIENYKETLKYLSVTDTKEYDDFCEMLVKSNPDMCRAAALYHAREEFINYKNGRSNA